jgi:pimeloyl-ACP methyl ester carboxylesterase
VSGEGEPVIFLHDLFPGAASYEWSKVYPAFSSTHRVLAPDWIGFGESERPDRPLRAEDYAQSLQEFVRATCGGRRPILVGSGLGAALACLASAQHPELASRLFLFHPVGTADWISPWVPAPMRAIAWSARGRHWLYERYMAKPACLERWLAKRRSAGEPIDLSEAVSVYASFARQYGAEWAVARVMSGRFRVDALPEIERLCVPTIIWWPALSAGPAPAISGRPPVRLDSLEEAGALAPLDRAIVLVERLRTEVFEPVRLAGG